MSISVIKSILDFLKDRIEFVKKDQRGIIIIVALVMVIMLTMVALDLHATTLRTYERIRNENNAIQAEWFADGAMETLLYELKSLDAGFNLDKVTCNYGMYKEGQGEKNGFCKKFDSRAGEGTSDEKNVRFAVEIKGRAEDSEKLETGECGTLKKKFNNSCYTVPLAGTGSAGVRCNMYEPSFDGEDGASALVSGTITGVKYPVDQVNYSCNWDKLVLGSGDLDRTAIPLYYEGEDGIVNPFQDGFKANNLILRVRTPCLPCGKPDKNKILPPGTRVCENNQDETVCEDKDRYKLDDKDGDGDATYKVPNVEGNDIVVHWRLYGGKESGSDEICGLTAIPEPKSKLMDIQDVENYYGSAIYEFSINYQKGFGNYYLLDIKEEQGHDICSDPKIDDKDKRKDIDKVLKTLDKPVLTLSVSAPLWSKEGYHIPYLEYQLLTDHPVSNPKMKLEANTIAEGMGGMKVMYRETLASIIDFAVQN